MADIYRAVDAELGRPVAVKILAGHCAEDDGIRERFICEGRAAARLSGDAHTVTIYDVGDVGGRPYIVMEYLAGGSLATRMAAGTIDADQALTWLEQAARALDTAHEHGVVHRDVKPGNLLLDSDDNVYVADFGIAHATGLDSNTQTGVVLGTLGYLAPEQAAGDRATAASDRYTFAVVAHELLTGARPGPTPSSKLPPRAYDVFARALAERPNDRHGSCLEFVAALEAALAPPTAPTVAVRPPRRKRSRRAPLLLAAGLGLGTIAFVATAALIDGQAEKPPQTVVRTVSSPAPQQAAVTHASASPPAPVAAVANATAGKHGKGHGKGHKKEKRKKD
jgi:serine/threonine-protein kinase